MAVSRGMGRMIWGSRGGWDGRWGLGGVFFSQGRIEAERRMWLMLKQESLLRTKGAARKHGGWFGKVCGEWRCRLVRSTMDIVGSACRACGALQ